MRRAIMTRPTYAAPHKRRKPARARATGAQPTIEQAPNRATTSWLGGLTGYTRDLFFKFTNDCTMNLVSTVPFSVFTAFVPLCLAVVLFLALLPGSSQRAHSFAEQISICLPSPRNKDA